VHIPDGFLSPPVWATLDVASAGCVAVVARSAQREAGDHRQIPLLGVMGAFVFAAQMINFPVGLGTSGHLVGGTLLAIVLGPAAAVVVMTAILAVQAFVFQSRKPFVPARFEEYLGALTQVYGQDMLRYKGVLFMSGSPRRQILQGVHMMVAAEPGRPWGREERPSSTIVFIGRKLPREAILKGLEACLAR